MICEDKIRMDYVFVISETTGKMQIMVNIGLEPEQTTILAQVKDKVMPYMESRFLRKRVAKINLESMPIEFKSILQGMIIEKRIKDHEYHIWFNGREI